MAVTRPTSRAVFIDKDGTLVENLPFNVDPQKIALAPGAEVALPALAAAGFRIIVVSNQSGVARGLFAERDLGPVEGRIRELLAELGVRLDGFYYCPHHPKGVVPGYKKECSCRKPNPGLLVRAAAEMGVDLSRSWMIGDILHDVEAGRRAGCHTVLIGNGNETEWVLSPERIPDFVATELGEASTMILSASRSPMTDIDGDPQEREGALCNPRSSA